MAHCTEADAHDESPAPALDAPIEVAPVLPPEVEEGNVEYKLKLCNATEERIEHLVSQLKWRLAEGQGAEAVYQIGVSDDGEPMGLSPAEMRGSLATLQRMADRLGLAMQVAHLRQGRSPGSQVCQARLRRPPPDAQAAETRVGMLGAAGSGKSSTVAVLTTGTRDDGRGLARMHVSKHKHELDSGRTASVSSHTIGIDRHGQPTTMQDAMPSSVLVEPEWADIVRRTVKVIKFVDLAGHHRYLRSTLRGLTAHRPHVILLAVAADQLRAMHGHASPRSRACSTGSEQSEAFSSSDSAGEDPPPAGRGRFCQQVKLCQALRIPFFVVVTKVDADPQGPRTAEGREKHARQVTGALAGVLRGCGLPVEVADVHDGTPEPAMAALIERMAGTARYSAESGQGALCVPCFRCSNVTKTNIPALRKFLRMVPASVARQGRELREEPPIFHISETFGGPESCDGPGAPIVGGLLRKGQVEVGDELCMGPITVASAQFCLEQSDWPESPKYLRVKVKSIQSGLNCSVGKMVAGQSGTLALQFQNPNAEETVPQVEDENIFEDEGPSPNLFGDDWDDEDDNVFQDDQVRGGVKAGQGSDGATADHGSGGVKVEHGSGGVKVEHGSGGITAVEASDGATAGQGSDGTTGDQVHGGINSDQAGNQEQSVAHPSPALSAHSQQSFTTSIIRRGLVLVSPSQVPAALSGDLTESESLVQQLGALNHNEVTENTKDKTVHLPFVVRSFVANVDNFVELGTTRHHVRLKRNAQYTCFFNGIKQLVRVVHVENSERMDVMPAVNRICKLSFMVRDEYMEPGMRFVLRNGNLLLFGSVLELC